MEEPRNARVVPTTELVGPTSGVVASVRRFIGSVGAVHAAVTHPRLYDAVAVVVALELGRTALRYPGRFGATLSLELMFSSKEKHLLQYIIVSNTMNLSAEFLEFAVGNHSNKNFLIQLIIIGSDECDGIYKRIVILEGRRMGKKIKKLSCRRLLHSFSSEPSEQSGLPSHIHVSGIHSPLALRQVNSSVLHTRFSEIKTQQEIRIMGLHNNNNAVFKIKL
ncbi:hypothetical protein AGLY_001150 [Aphis glycines]|uniref:Uncharacterized protein n=1 Tax=Aphis glycines TaxID=307491 RepID=A0A6G0U9H7_APHGL|nr:hypothetical protein AGLY_001150 [Aphis glycines]